MGGKRGMRLVWILLVVVALGLWPAVALGAPPGGDPIGAATARPYLGLSYSPYRDGQAPGASSPTWAQVTEDMNLLAREGARTVRWRSYSRRVWSRSASASMRDARAEATLASAWATWAS